MITIVDAKPGFGKTLLMTYFAYKNFKEKNPPLKVWFTEHIKRKPYVYDISEYSDFPIVFKKPKKKKGKYRKYYYYDYFHNVCETDKITSLKVRIFDLILDNKFKDNANFYIDEIQQKYDSMEYKDFPDSIAHYFQAHRHFNNNIYTNSQSQSRIIKRVLCLGEEYWSVYSFKIRFGFVIMHVRITYDMHNNLESNNGNTNVEYYDKRIIFRIKKIGNMYDSKYLRYLQEDSKPYLTDMYDSLQLDKETILHSFFPTIQEKEKLKNQRY